MATPDVNESNGVTETTTLIGAWIVSFNILFVVIGPPNKILYWCLAAAVFTHKVMR